MCRRARPRPVLRTSAQSRRQWVPLYIPHSGQEIGLVHRKGVKLFLPQVAAPPFAEIDRTRIAPVDLPQRGAQSIRLRRHHHKMHVVGHQAIRPHSRPRLAVKLRHELKIACVITVAKNSGETWARPIRSVPLEWIHCEWPSLQPNWRGGLHFVLTRNCWTWRRSKNWLSMCVPGRRHRSIDWGCRGDVSVISPAPTEPGWLS